VRARGLGDGAADEAALVAGDLVVIGAIAVVVVLGVFICMAQMGATKLSRRDP